MISDAISSRLVDAEAAIDHDGELPLARRGIIRRMLLEIGNAWPRVEIEAVRRVLPMWAAFHPGTLPIDLLALTDAYLSGQVGRSQLEEATDHLQEVVESLDAGGDALREVANIVGWAAVRAAWSAMEPGDDDSMDADPWEWTASFAASMVAAGGAIWDGRGDSASRREFWQWWLRDAVPAAVASNDIQRR